VKLVFLTQKRSPKYFEVAVSRGNKVNETEQRIGFLWLARKSAVPKRFRDCDGRRSTRKAISQWTRLHDRFNDDPSIENYVALRRFQARVDTDIYRFAGVDPFQALGKDLEQAGLDRALVCGALPAMTGY